MRKALRRQDITFEDKDQALRHDVHMLGTLVGELIREQAGDELFDLVENTRLRSIRRREHNEKPGEELADLVRNLDLSLAMEVIRSFSTYSKCELSPYSRRTRPNRHGAPS
jgi:phosphoenolpyruvate carboxylase